MSQPVQPDPTRDARLRTLGRWMFERIAREHPTLLFTLAYLGLTFVGLIYDLWFFRYFKINILDYSEMGDFLLSAFRNPLVILLSILPIVPLAVLQKLREAARARSVRYDEYVKKYESTRWNSPGFRALLFGLFIAIYAILFTQLYAARAASKVKAGIGQRVTFARNDGASVSEKPILLGSTAKFFFLYYPSRRETEIVPVDNTAMITIDSRRRKEREADSLSALRKAVP